MTDFKSKMRTKEAVLNVHLFFVTTQEGLFFEIFYKKNLKKHPPPASLGARGVLFFIVTKVTIQNRAQRSENRDQIRAKLGR